MGTTKERIKNLLRMHTENKLIDVSDVGQADFPDHRLLMQSELFELLNAEGCWVMIPTGEPPEYSVQELITVIWQHMQWHKEWYLGGKAIHVPITLSNCGDLLIVAELLSKTDNTISKIILITIADDESCLRFYA